MHCLPTELARTADLIPNVSLEILIAIGNDLPRIERIHGRDDLGIGCKSGTITRFATFDTTDFDTSYIKRRRIDRHVDFAANGLMLLLISHGVGRGHLAAAG